MTTRAVIDEFLAQRRLAVVGASRSKGKFGNAAYRALRAAGYRVFAVNPEAGTIEGDPAYPSLAALPEPVGGVLVVVPPEKCEAVVREAEAAGIRYVWMQQGAESDAAIAWCNAHGLRCVDHQCILMFAEPSAWFHRAHRFMRRVTGRLPH